MVIRKVLFMSFAVLIMVFAFGTFEARSWERVGDAAWAEVVSLDEFEDILEQMLCSFEEHAVIRLKMKRCLEEGELDDILDGILYRKDLVAASLDRMEATIRFASGMNTIEFIFTWIETARQREEVLRNVPGIISSIFNSKMSEREKLEAIHDHVVSTVDYDDKMKGSGAWSAMYGRSVCQGYALLTGALLTGAGFENRIVLNDDHAWNLVYAEGVWRHLDTSFDDPVIVGGGSPAGILREAFLKTDEQMRALGHTWDEKRYPEAR